MNVWSLLITGGEPIATVLYTCAAAARDYVNIKAVTSDSRHTSSLQASNIGSCTRRRTWPAAIPQREREDAKPLAEKSKFIKSGDLF